MLIFLSINLPIATPSQASGDNADITTDNPSPAVTTSDTIVAWEEVPALLRGQCVYIKNIL